MRRVYPVCSSFLPALPAPARSAFSAVRSSRAPLGLTDDGEDLVAEVSQPGGADARDLRERGEGPGAGAGDGVKDPVVEDDVGGDPLFACTLPPPGPQQLEQGAFLVG